MNKKLVMVTDPEYQNHIVFSEIDTYIKFYKELSECLFSWLSSGIEGIYNIDSYVFSSIQGTLTSIRSILRDGRINDAYALLRKYYDSTIINIYSILYLSDHFSIKNFIVEHINNWRKGETQLPEYRIMSQYIRNSPKAKPITDVLFSDERYKNLRNRCNDHTHYNFYHNVLFNDNEIAFSGRIQLLNNFSTDVRDVLILHVAYLFFLNEHYMMSSDYIDFLECGIAPEPDSIHWVAPFIQDFFNNIVTKYRPDITAKIKEYTRMYLT